VIQVLLLVAAHPQPLPLDTPIDPLPAFADCHVTDAGEMVIVQGAPACVTVKVLPAIVTVPVRDVVVVLAVTL
jgi:hypothetical protein